MTHHASKVRRWKIGIRLGDTRPWNWIRPFRHFSLCRMSGQPILCRRDLPLLPIAHQHGMPRIVPTREIVMRGELKPVFVRELLAALLIVVAGIDMRSHGDGIAILAIAIRVIARLSDRDPLIIDIAFALA